jgi:hypothetical protein
MLAPRPRGPGPACVSGTVPERLGKARTAGLSVPPPDETAEPMKVTFNVTGPLIWLDENGQATGHFDVFDYIALCKDHYEKAGFGVGYIEGLFR